MIRADDYWRDRAAQMAGNIATREFVAPETLRQYRRVCRLAGVDWIEQLDWMREFLDTDTATN